MPPNIYMGTGAPPTGGVSDDPRAEHAALAYAAVHTSALRKLCAFGETHRAENGSEATSVDMFRGFQDRVDEAAHVARMDIAFSRHANVRKPASRGDLCIVCEMMDDAECTQLLYDKYRWAMRLFSIHWSMLYVAKYLLVVFKTSGVDQVSPFPSEILRHFEECTNDRLLETTREEASLSHAVATCRDMCVLSDTSGEVDRCEIMHANVATLAKLITMRATVRDELLAASSAVTLSTININAALNSVDNEGEAMSAE